MILPVSFYSRSTLKVLKDLIGKVLVRKSEDGLTSGVIVEAEAYTGEDDPASYAFSGRTKRSEIMYGPPGRAFVHFTYGMHHMLNLVTEREEFPAAILIRALEPREGISLMKKRRQTEELINLCSGPAKICQAFGIDRSHNGLLLFSSRSPVFIKEGERREKRKEALIWTSRIGIQQGKERLWRANLKGSPFISVK
jgi:DNA-3-methyladenine glycosylase